MTDLEIIRALVDTLRRCACGAHATHENVFGHGECDAHRDPDVSEPLPHADALRAALARLAPTRRATFVRDVTGATSAVQKLYRVEPPWPGRVCYCCDQRGPSHAHVVVSMASPELTGARVGPQTYVFAADGHGEITSYMRLPGSQEVTMDCEKVLRDAGYEVVA